VTQVEEIEQAVASLPMEEYHLFREWFLRRESDAWDRQIGADSASGNLDFLVEEAEEEKRQGSLRSL
jgi:hypothetical protein